ncbi:hydroxymethylbilane synthase [Cellulomonas sp. PSBB021]|uniref:hydroxymethylbilane synthase n=1 Tax=Cellulomonas sp. PSBB021 TaxID=2003551 RepID=UPI000B8D5E45|nr:hydroxymethylbilane synthase [Cellulomonas sp. PSBB021]ASR55923.1 hydroxymethylbilane synthase [Cellulomonas sp. PSBB021]
MSVVRIGTRASTLARTQTGHVADALTRLGGFEVETVHVRTEGDRLTGSLATLGGTGVFVTALRDALLDGRCDVAVHSLKDLPTAPAPGLTIAAVPLREDPRDVLCARDGLRLHELPAGARVGTGSPRRAAQLLAARPDLEVVDIRGNVDTRLGRVAGSSSGPGDLDAVVLARAGLARLGRLEAVTEALDPHVMLPAPGQGALAVEVRTADLDDPPTPVLAALATALAALDHRPTRLAVAAERALLARLEAGCAAPVGALALVDGPRLELEAVVARTDGTRLLRHGLTSTAVVVREGAEPDDEPHDGPQDAPNDGAHGGTHSGPHDEPAGAAGGGHREQDAAAAGADLADLLLERGAADLAPVGPRS